MTVTNDYFAMLVPYITHIGLGILFILAYVLFMEAVNVVYYRFILKNAINTYYDAKHYMPTERWVRVLLRILVPASEIVFITGPHGVRYKAKIRLGRVTYLEPRD